MEKRAKAGKVGHSSGDKVFYAVNDILLLLALLVVLYPVIYIVSSSFSSGSAVSTGKVVLWPVDFSLEGYKTAFEYPQIVSGFRNTFFYMIAGTIINLVMTVLAAYPLSRPGMKGRGLIMFLFTFTMIFTGGLIPDYILMQRLGLVNTRWAMLLPGAIGVFNLIICRTFFQNNIPEELYESASIDGCSHPRFLTSVVLPLSKPILAVLTLYYAVGHWNAYFNAFIYLSDRNKFPLQIILREILVMNMIDPSSVFDPELEASKYGLADLLKYALIVVSTVPFMVAYPFVAKHFVKGALSGAVKG
ncbi:MAG: carbohydrate ABC transporter permease [Treponema sp.]|jgi:multiple sugar transport system permease protein/putative aldouronate transport system permease protein|nr:carbohydrate ABC transporter permease [Treponema sp.]